MTFPKIILLAVALSVDSMAVSLSGSISAGRMKWSDILKVSMILAIIQTAFLASGYVFGELIGNFVEKWGKWIGFSLLLYVGAEMIIEAIKDDGETTRDFCSVRKIIIAAVATSIDALASGASFGLIDMPADDLTKITVATFIATVIFAASGMLCGSAVGKRFSRPARFVAGLVLIAIGVEILI